MHGIPADLDLSHLIGDRLDSITIQEYQIAFNFDRGTSFVIEGQVEIALNDRAVAQWNQEAGWSSTAFQTFVGATVESVSIPSSKELKILFNSNRMLRIFDNSSQYESFHIYPQEIHI